MAWAMEGALNPMVLRLHVTDQLTTATIVTCPPADAPPPLDRLLGIEGLRSIDLQRYRVRFNLAPGAGRARVTSEATEALQGSWGPPSPLPPEELPRAFAVERTGLRLVAESVEMAAADPILAKTFAIEGVAEAIGGEGLVLVRLGRLYRWAEVSPVISVALSA